MSEQEIDDRFNGLGLGMTVGCLIGVAIVVLPIVAFFMVLGGGAK